MPLRTPLFEYWVDQARQPPGSAWRLLGGLAIVALAWLVMTVVVLVSGAALAHFAANAGLGSYSLFPLGNAVERFMATGAGLVALLLSFSGMWLGVWIAVRRLHRRPMAGVLGGTRDIARADFLRAMAVFAGLVFIAGLMSVATDPFVVRSALSPAAWAMLAIAIAAALLVQTSAEEVLFRGYLMQGLAARFRSLLVWLVLPTIGFAVLHWNAAAGPAQLAALLASVALLALALAWLVIRTGSLAAAMGAHFGNNMVAVTFVSPDEGLGQAALFVRKFEAGSIDWTVAAATIVQVIVFLTLALFLLLHRRSWFALDAARNRA